ncbi:MAG: hypothetical protein Q9223_005792 [Gallowayella weberi]
MDDKLQAFRHWFLEHGGTFGEHVELHYKPARGSHLRLSQKSTLSAGSCIISCPHSLTLSCYNAHSFADEFGHDPAGDANSISSWNLFRFFLVEQYQLKNESFWQPYICTLPDPLTKHPFNTPLYYDEEDSTFLRGTSLEPGATNMQKDSDDCVKATLTGIPGPSHFASYRRPIAEFAGICTNGPPPL